MTEKTKTRPNFGKILLSFLIGVIMCPIWMSIVFIIDISKTPMNDLFKLPLLERTPFAYLYYWLSAFLPGNLPYYRPTQLLAFLSNTILYFALSYILLSLFERGGLSGKKILSVAVGVLMNPLLIVILFNTDRHITLNKMLSITQLDDTFFGCMFNWSSRILPFQLDFRAELLLAHISNAILYFALTYGSLNLLSRLIDRENELR